MKIGIFAGTFDPIHSGHIDFAKNAISEAGLDKVIIVAEKEPYRKKPVTSWDHRQAMVERATNDIDQVDHDYHFANLLAHQHTMKDMIQIAKKHYGGKSQYWFLVGSDLFEHMNKWKDTIANHEYGGFVVALRSDHTHEWLRQQQSFLKSGGLEVTVLVIDNKKPKVSSSNVRSNINTASDFTNVADDVISYIQAHNLYQ